MAKQLSIRERQEIALGIMKEIKRVSEILNIRFYLAYGTLLGAVRHNGFIPWDDDVDIWLWRKDYEIFLERFNDIADKNYRLYSYRNTTPYPFLMPKVIDIRTTCREKWMRQNDYLGIWVDIAPIDYLSEKSEKMTEHLIALEHRRWCSMFPLLTVPGKIKMFFYNIFSKDTSIKDFTKGPNYFEKEIDEIHSCTSEHPSVRMPNAVGCFNIVYPASDFDKTIWIDYEKEKMPIPSGYDHLLRTVYGDYMKLPPKNKQKFDGHLKSISLR